MNKFEIAVGIVELIVGIYFTYIGSNANVYLLLMSGYHFGKGLWTNN